MGIFGRVDSPRIPHKLRYSQIVIDWAPAASSFDMRESRPTALFTEEMSSETQGTKPLSANEPLKAASTSCADLSHRTSPTPPRAASRKARNQLAKFHGMYIQDDRDQRTALKKAGLEKAFSFMLRVRLPGGRATAKQWIVLDSARRPACHSVPASHDAPDFPVPRHPQGQRQEAHPGHAHRAPRIPSPPAAT